jgi:hypothetical protein
LLLGAIFPSIQKISIFELSGCLGRVDEEEHNAHEEKQNLYGASVKHN